MEMEKRNKFINVRYSEKEFNLIDTQAKKIGYSRSEYIRLLSLSQNEIIYITKEKIIGSESIGDEKKTKLLLNIANNVNQITKLANQKKDIPSIEILKDIQNQIENYLDDKFK
jgi:NADH:ubiquinone oxidoreductase subunit E